MRAVDPETGFRERPDLWISGGVSAALRSRSLPKALGDNTPVN
jgi:hypothetical protein